jgi:iron complex outermembrane receptor protein
MKSLSKYGLFASTALAIGLGAPMAVQAADAPQNQPSATELQEVVVTATRKEEKLQNVPISITAFSQAQLAQHNITNGEDLVEYTPSLSSVNYLGTTNTTFGLRGFQQVIGTQPAVGVYFADVVMPRGAANEMTIGDGAGPGYFFDLQNVQVLNGPQGTLFGRNTTGGDILLVPNRPNHNFGGYVETEFGNYADQRIQAVVNLPLSDTLAIRIGVDHHSRDGYLRNTTDIGPTNFNDINYTAVRASVLWNITPTLENYTVFSYLADRSNGTDLKLNTATPSASPFFGTLAADELARNPGFYSVDSNQANAEDHEWQWQVINTTTWHATDDLTIKNIASYAELQLDLASSVFGVNLFANSAALQSLGLPAAYANALAGLNPPIQFTTSDPLPGGHTGYQSTMTEELQVQGYAFDRRLNYTAGLYTEGSMPLGPVGSISPALISCNGFQCANAVSFGGPPIGGNNTTEAETGFHNYGVYIQAGFNITDQLTLTGGFRYTWDRESVNSQRISYDYGFSLTPQAPLFAFCTVNPGGALPCADLAVSKSSAPTGLVELQYKPTADIMAYAKYSRGYRAGGVQVQAPASIPTFQPEHLNAYEVGFKTQWRSVVRGTFNVAGFYNTLSSQQISVGYAALPTALFLPFTTGIVNAGSSKIYGVELQGSIKPTESTRVDFGYTYLKTEITAIGNVGVPASTGYFAASVPLKGDPQTNAPENKFTLTGAYTLPIPADAGDLTVSATFNYTDPQATGYTQRDASGKLTGLSLIKAIQLLDLNLDWRHVGGSPVDLSVFANNVLARHYYLTGIDETSSLGFSVAQVGMPRMFGVRLRYNFGH